MAPSRSLRLASQTPFRTSGHSGRAPSISVRSQQEQQEQAMTTDSDDDESDAGNDESSKNGDSSSDDEDDEGNDDSEEGDVQSPLASYPFEFDTDDRPAGTTDDPMDVTSTTTASLSTTPAPRNFEESMEFAETVHAIAGAHDLDADDYASVDALSDDDGDDQGDDDGEDDILRQAEQDLITEFELTEEARARDVLHLTDPKDRRLGLNDASSDLCAVPSAVNMNEDPWKGASFMDDAWGSLWGDAEMSIWRKPPTDGQRPQTSPSTTRQKRVRFHESAVNTARSSSSSSESSGDEDDDVDRYPDIFMDSADPQIQQLLAGDPDAEWNGIAGADGSDRESAYDFEDDADRFAFEMDEDSESSDGGRRSESEEDGDETEDESMEEQQAKMQKFRKAMRQVAAASVPSTPISDTRPSSSSKGTPSGRRTSTPRLARGPRQGVFVCDPRKATLTSDKSGRKTILYPPVQPSAEHKAFWERARSAATSRDDSPRGSIAFPTRARDESPERPFTAKATLASMFDGRLDFLQPDQLTPNEPAQAPPVPVLDAPVSLFVPPTDDASDVEAGYPASFNTILNMEQFEDDSSDTDMATPAPIASSREPAFLTQGVVGSFRLNQNRAKHESSLPLHPAKRASTAEHNALQTGRRGAGNAPITPARKRRTSSQDLHRTGSGVRKAASTMYASPRSPGRRHSRGQSLAGRLDQTLTPEMWKKM